MSPETDADQDVDTDALAAFGLVIEDEPEQVRKSPEFVLWPEQVRSLRAWLLIQTQWTVGVAGRTGIHYGSAVPLLQARGLGGSRLARVVADLQVMELAALEEFGKRQAAEQQRARSTRRR